MMRIINPISKEYLEQILDSLPQPLLMEVNIYYNNDHSGLIPGILKETIKGQPIPEYAVKEGAVFEIREPSKEVILAIYASNSMSLKKVQWYLERGSSVTLTPTSLEIYYKGSEPEPITQVRKVIEKNHACVSLEARIGK